MSILRNTGIQEVLITIIFSISIATDLKLGFIESVSYFILFIVISVSKPPYHKIKAK